MKPRHFLACSLLLLVGLLEISAALHGTIPPGTVVLRVLPWAALSLAVAAAASVRPAWSRVALVLSADGFLLYESILGILQVFGRASSRHVLFRMTGSFDNPGPYGCFVAVVSVVVLTYLLEERKQAEGGPKRLLLILSALALSAGLSVLPASLSRTGWVAFALGGAVAIVRAGDRVRNWLRQHRALAISFITGVVAVCGVGLWLIKPDSARGRLHMWRIECLAVMEHPLSGSGPDAQMSAYGQAQEHFFARKMRSAGAIAAAGCPEYAFNEYLGLAMQGGIGAGLLAIAAVVLSLLALRKTYPEAFAGMFAWSVCAAASYPLSVSPLNAALAVFLGLALSGGGRTGKTILAATAVIASVFFAARTREARHIGRVSFRALYEQGYALHESGMWDESDSLLKEGLKYSSDPMFLNIMGKNAEAQGLADDAEALYLRSIHRVPCRLYPRLLLSRLYLRTGRPESALEASREALAMPVHPRHKPMQELHERLRAVEDSAKMALNSPLVLIK